MLAKVSTKDLTKVLKLCEAVADKKASMSVFSMVLININPEQGKLEFLATDLDQGFKGKVQGEVEGESQSFCVPAKKFYEIIKNFPEDEVLLVKEDSRLIVRDLAERITYELAIGDSSEFPALPDFNEEQAIDIPGHVLSLLIKKTSFASSKEEARFVLSGIYFEPLKEEGKLRAVASDGHRLALFEAEVIGLDRVELSPFILSRKSAREIANLSEDKLTVKLAYINNYVVLWTSLGVFFSRAIEGSFPDYRAVIPSTFERVVKVDRRLFMDALRRVSLLVTEKFKPVTLTLNKNELILTSQETELGRSRIRLGCSYEGEPFSITFNSGYLLDPLEVMQSEEVDLKLGDERTPAGVFGYRDKGFLYLVMPMVVN
jgi:DNA polymerase-3 subunit beta